MDEQMSLLDQPVESQAKAKSEPEFLVLTRCAGCYNHMKFSKLQRSDMRESSSSEDSGPEADYESSSSSSSSSSSEAGFNEPKTQDSPEHTVAPDLPVLEGEKLSDDTTEISEGSADRRAERLGRKAPLVRSFSLPSDFARLESLWPRPPTVVSLLNLQVLPPRHSYDPYYTIRRCPSDSEVSKRDDRRGTGQPEVTVPVQQTPVLPLQHFSNFPQQPSPQLMHQYGLYGQAQRRTPQLPPVFRPPTIPQNPPIGHTPLHRYWPQTGCQCVHCMHSPNTAWGHAIPTTNPLRQLNHQNTIFL